eukprot:SAG31_NODE_6355_length_2047_cov_1.557495_2_plen_45_part_00
MAWIHWIAQHSVTLLVNIHGAVDFGSDGYQTEQIILLTAQGEAH